MQTLVQIVVVTILWLLAYEAFRRAGKWVSWGLFFLVPLALTPYWFAVNSFDLFWWVKSYSVYFCIVWGTALRFTSLGERPWACNTIHLLLAGNILEAIAVDVLETGLAHTLNASAGLILIATLPYGSDSSRIDSAGRYRDLHSGTSLRWIVGYTIWNWTFVYLNYPSLSGHHTAVLAAGLIVAAIDARRWTQARACTLGLNLLVSATFYPEVTSWCALNKMLP